MIESGCIYSEFSIPSEDVATRVAVLIINDSQLKNMEEHGDALFIDGTYASLSTK